MKKTFVIGLLLIISMSLFSQADGDRIIGYYYLKDPFSGAISQARIYKAGNGTYQGIVEWAQDADRKKFEGLIFLKDLTYSSVDKEWKNGKVQYPGKKGVFDTQMRFEANGMLRVRGYWKMAMLGKTVYWKKESVSRKTL